MFLDLGLERVERAVLANASFLSEGLRERGCTLLAPGGDVARSGIVAFRHPRLANAAVVEALGERGVRCIEREGWVRFAPHCYHRARELERILAALPR